MRLFSLAGFILLMAIVPLSNASACIECVNLPPPSCNQDCVSGRDYEDCDFGTWGGCWLCSGQGGDCFNEEDSDQLAAMTTPAGTAFLPAGAVVTRGSQVVSVCDQLVVAHVDVLESAPRATEAIGSILL